MKTNKIGVMFLVSVMALAAIGSSYAMWSETITMTGTVTTGNVDIEFRYNGVYNSEETYPPEKWVSSVTGHTSDDRNSLIITLNNVYPCIYYKVYFDIHCIGSVPVHFTQGFYGDTVGQFLLDNGIVTITPGNDYSGYPSGEITNPDETQLHKCQRWFGILTFHLTNDLWDMLVDEFGWQQGGGPYTFTISIMGHQYNENP